MIKMKRSKKMKSFTNCNPVKIKTFKPSKNTHMKRKTKCVNKMKSGSLEDENKTISWSNDPCKSDKCDDKYNRMKLDPLPYKYDRLKFGKEHLVDTSLDIEDETKEGDNFKKKYNFTSKQEESFKKLFRDRKKMINNKPILYLREAGNEASLSTEYSARYPIFYPDIEDFISFIQGKLMDTRWIHIKKMAKVDNVIFITVEGAGLEDYCNNIDTCPTLKSFNVVTEYVSPLSYGDEVEHCVASRLDPATLKETASEGFQNMASRKVQDGFIVGLDSFFNIKSYGSKIILESNDKQEPIIYNFAENEAARDYLEKIGNKFDLHPNIVKRIFRDKDLCFRGNQVLPIAEYHRDKFSRLKLVMTPREMANEKYPIPFGRMYSHFVKTKDEYSEVTNQSPMFGLDCEMCLTSAGNELTRVSIVNEKHEVVYERLVKPYNPIKNYLTQYSGITKQMLQDVTTRLPDVQLEIKKLLPSDAILVGQSLNFDLIALKMMHPYVIDSSLVFNLTGNRQIRTKLKILCARYLSKTIQSENKLGHDSYEDAMAALELIQEKLKHSLEWGNATLGYTMAEEQQEPSHSKLLENDNINLSEKPKLAVNSLVDDPYNFDPAICKKSLSKELRKLEKILLNPENRTPIKRKAGPDENDTFETLDENDKHETPKNKRIKFEIDEDKVESKTKGKRKKDETEDSGVEDNMLSDNNRLTESDQQDKVLQKDQNKVVHQRQTWQYENVSIMGDVIVIDKYKKYLPESVLDKVIFHETDSNRTTVNKVIESDSTPNKQLIIAHLNSKNINKVNKWSNKILQSCKSNNLFCLTLNGKDDSNGRGVFFASIPGSNFPPIQQVIDEFLTSQGIKHS